jgi:transcriptional regulator with XRE-family HTH domain
MDPALQEPPAGYHPGTIVRATRKARGLTLAELGKSTGYSAALVSRYERGITPLTAIAVLRRFASALSIPRENGLGDLLITRMRDAMLGLAPCPSGISPGELSAGLAGALADFHHCRYSQLADRLPRLISAGHLLAADDDTAQTSALLATTYTLATRMLIKLDDQQLGWMAADRAQVIATGSGDPLISAEAARNLAVLARKAGWHAQAASIALTAAASLGLRGTDPRLAAERGLLIQSAAYTAARAADRDGMRELTSQAAAIAARLDGAALLRDHGRGFTPATVGLHRISAETHSGDPAAALAAAAQIAPPSLPITERRARYWTDTARAYSMWASAKTASRRCSPPSTQHRRRSTPGRPSAT